MIHQAKPYSGEIFQGLRSESENRNQSLVKNRSQIEFLKNCKKTIFTVKNWFMIFISIWLTIFEHKFYWT